MSDYTAKDWDLNNPITEADLDHIEDGIADAHTELAALDTLLKTDPGVVITSDRTATVTSSLTTYVRPSSPYIVVASFTPAINGHLRLHGFVTLTHSVSTGTPTMAWALTNGSGAVLISGAAGTRGEPGTGSVALPVSADISVTAGVAVTVHLAVSSSVAGTVTIEGGRSRIDGAVLPA